MILKIAAFWLVDRLNFQLEWRWPGDDGMAGLPKNNLSEQLARFNANRSSFGINSLTPASDKK